MFDDLIIPKKHHKSSVSPKKKRGVDLSGAMNSTTAPIVHGPASPCSKCNSTDLSILMHHLNPYTGRKEFFVECKMCGHQYWSL